MNNSSFVHIVLADEGWILERYAREIEKRLDYVTVSRTPDPAACINYYLNYTSYQGKQPGIDIGFFTHIEPSFYQGFFTIAEQMDYCICMSSLYANELYKKGVQNIFLICPGVDLDNYSPAIRIGVVGRTYETGRKGEELVKSVMDEPGIEWHFAGTGWPKPGIMYLPEEMPKFYNNIDYLLIPAYYEGGPMSLLEALACGREVIAPPIGFVPEYPHIEFKTGDSEDLRRVFRELMEKRQKIRDSVINRSWNSWAKHHDILFRKILNKIDPIKFPPKKNFSVLLAMGADENINHGGPSTRILQTKNKLEKLGLKVEISSEDKPDIKNFDLVHVFNIWPPDKSLEKLRFFHEQEIPIVFSPIYLCLSEYAWAIKAIPSIFQQGRSNDEIEKQIVAVQDGENLIELPQRFGNNEILPGYHEFVRECINLVDMVIGLSDFEIHQLLQIGALNKPYRIVRNSVEIQPYQDIDGSEFFERYKITDYVLCVGRLEIRKNQLMLIQALRNTGIPLVLIGKESDSGYSKLVHSFAGENVHFIGEIANSSSLLASAYAGAKVFCLPSWSEGAPISALEAAASGVPLVLSNRSGEFEYFKDEAFYCDPMDPEDIKGKILAAYENSPLRLIHREQIQKSLRSELSIEQSMKDTISVYEQTKEIFEWNQIVYSKKNEIDFQSKNNTKLAEAQSEQNQVYATLSASLQAENEKLGNELKNHQDLIDAKNTELQNTQEELEARNTELQNTQEELESRNTELQNTQEELESRNTELQSTQEELGLVYHSRSYRITAPMRAVFGFGRVQRDQLRQLRSKLAIRTRARRLLGKTVKFSRGIPLVALLIEKIKRHFPTAWRRMSTKVKGTISEPQQSTSINIGNSEDETHFLNLFQREINKRKDL
jgi:glycosyltransferase involved in cell wall biosynthesis